MDYVVGSIAALISGNVTPNRPKVTKRALTPTKHIPSPNVTPKSEFVNDRSIFLSPTTQKKKAIVKKSPKRIFQNPDLDGTNEKDGNVSTASPKADKVKKHLKNELEANTSLNTGTEAGKSPKKKRSKSAESPSPSKNSNNNNSDSKSPEKANVSALELTPKKKRKQQHSVSEAPENISETLEPSQSEGPPQKKKKHKKRSFSENTTVHAPEETIVNGEANTLVDSPKKKKKKNRLTSQTEQEIVQNPVDDKVEMNTSPKKKNKKRKKKNKQTELKTDDASLNENEDEPKQKKVKKIKVNPNAVTDKDSDSEHESDNEIESENEESNKQALEASAEVADESSDEEETPKPKKKKLKVEKPETDVVKEVNTEEEIKRTLFVGNVPFSKKCKKEIKKIFSKYGVIESVRIRTVPVKDPSVTPKVAVIKQELHPERTTVNVYVKFADPACMEAALAENNTVLSEHHLRVSRSGSSGAEHDARRAVFVGNVPFALEDEGLRAAFQGCGEVESVRIVRDKKTNAGKGFGYVNFVSKDSVELALALTDEDLTIKNRIMRVKRCTQATQRQLQNKQKFPGKKPGNFPGKQGFQGKSQGNFPTKQFQGNKVSQGNRQRQGPGKNFNQGRNSGQDGVHRGGNFNKGGFQNRGGFGRQEEGQKEGAYRRVMNKRKSEDGAEGAPREKKPRKEFVGMTAEKKKKHKFDKGQKKKKALSEILTK